MNYTPPKKDADGFTIEAKSKCHHAPIVVFDSPSGVFRAVMELAAGESGRCWRCNREVVNNSASDSVITGNKHSIRVNIDDHRFDW